MQESDIEEIMRRRAEITAKYTCELQEMGYSEKDANLIGQLLGASADHVAPAFTMSAEEYLLKRFAGYHPMESLKMNLDEDEVIMGDIPRKPNHETMDVINLNTDFIPKGGMGEIVKWARKILSEQGGEIRIMSSGRMVEFPRRGIESSVRKYDMDARDKLAHRQSYLALRKMVEIAQYWKSKMPAGRHSEDGRQDIYTSALNLNGKLYAVTIRCNEPNELTRKKAKEYGEELPDNQYKEHRIDKIEIDIAPAHNGTSAIDDGGSRPGSGNACPTGAISKISLGILRGSVKASMTIKDSLYDWSERKKPKGAMCTFIDGRRMIALFKNHDASTILHEMAHFWLEEIRDAHDLPSCPDWVNEIWQGLEDAFGFRKETVSRAEWIRIHERLAIEFEKYCAEGAAPAPELRPAFARFREWVSEVYDHVVEFLGSDRIRVASRRVFDAILAGYPDDQDDSASMSFRM